MLAFTEIKHSELVWFICVIGGVVTYIYSARKKRAQKVTTHFQSSIGFVWVAFGVTVAILGTAAGVNEFSIYPLITVLTATPTFTTGVIVKHKPLIYCGSLFWIFGTISFMVAPMNQIIIGGIAIIFGYLLPGYLMKYKKQ
ncbi:MAG: hypothetical protein JXR03_15615 [Cyclobacteriaceae bacterium]